MLHLTRVGRLSVSLCTVALITVAVATWDSRSIAYVFACAFFACVLGIGLALTICEHDDRRRYQ